jgi:hypothetical protein
MQGSLKKGVAASGALALAIGGTALANKPFLPKKAFYGGKTALDGKLTFKVRKHHIVYTTGRLPLVAGGTCEWGAEREAPLRLHNYNPVGNGPFKINARQKAYNNPTKRWRKLRIHIEGQFTKDRERAKGTLHVRFRDSDGVCETRDQLKWRVHRIRR